MRVLFCGYPICLIFNTHKSSLNRLIPISIPEPILKRTLSLRTTIAIVIGGVIGSGIFMKPALMAAQLQSPLLLLSVWMVAGIVTLFGALSNAEVAVMFPETGGQFVFFQKMYGPRFAFLYGWAAFAVFNTAGNASIAYVFSQYANYFIHLPRLSLATEQAYHLHIPGVGTIFPLEQIGVKLLTVFIIVVLTLINYFSVGYGSMVQRFLTALKAVAIVLLIGGILFSGKGSWEHLVTATPQHLQGLNFIGMYMAAVAGAFWAYDGWNNITFVAGEIKEPQRNIPRSLFTGLFFCIIVYVLLNLAFVYVLPIQQLANSSFVASDAASVVWGMKGGSLIALLVMLFVLGTTNANVLATARVTFATAASSKKTNWVGKIQSRYHTPGNALLLNACWTIILIFSGSFDMLTDMLIFVSWFFYGMSALGVFILRYKMKDFPRTYKVWGYPFVPLLFVVFAFFFLASTLYTDIINYRNGHTQVINSLLGILITCVGIPLYYFFKNRKP
ncbi:APA family basic amino acid/polyamine antiporter [Sediminibacterium magnilacihabitans]|nr:APA family basic amino acid/polyamine antiporter [Sediminibacterium magnilacihabitans]